MMGNKTKRIAGILVLSLVTLCIGIFIGMQLTQRTEVMFYANVLEPNEFTLLVQGIPENDINHRGEFIVSLRNPKDKNAVLDASGNAIGLDGLSKGDQVRITYDGTVLESYPVQITGAYEICVIS